MKLKRFFSIFAIVLLCLVGGVAISLYVMAESLGNVVDDMTAVVEDANEKVNAAKNRSELETIMVDCETLVFKYKRENQRKFDRYQQVKKGGDDVVNMAMSWFYEQIVADRIEKYNQAEEDLKNSLGDNSKEFKWWRFW